MLVFDEAVYFVDRHPVVPVARPDIRAAHPAELLHEAGFFADRRCHDVGDDNGLFFEFEDCDAYGLGRFDKLARSLGGAGLNYPGVDLHGMESVFFVYSEDY